MAIEDDVPMCGTPWPDWWKHVQPEPDMFWAQLVAAQLTARAAEPEPNPWRQNTAKILAGVALLNAAAAQRDTDVQAKLQREGAEQIKRALEQLAF